MGSPPARALCGAAACRCGSMRARFDAKRDLTACESVQLHQADVCRVLFCAAVPGPCEFLTSTWPHLPSCHVTPWWDTVPARESSQLRTKMSRVCVWRAMGYI